MFPYGETVTVLTAGTTTDRYGNEVPDWGNATSTLVPGCGVAPRSSSELNDPSRAAVIVGLTVYLPPGSVVSARDRMVVRGGTYEVVGEPGDWRSPFTGEAFGLEVALQRVEG